MDLTRENAAFERVRADLVRDHLGHIALIYGDEVVGAYPTLDQALEVGFSRFGLVRFICRAITERDEPEYIAHVDVTHPSVRPVD